MSCPGAPIKIRPTEDAKVSHPEDHQDREDAPFTPLKLSPKKTAHLQGAPKKEKKECSAKRTLHFWESRPLFWVFVSLRELFVQSIKKNVYSIRDSKKFLLEIHYTFTGLERDLIGSTRPFNRRRGDASITNQTGELDLLQKPREDRQFTFDCRQPSRNVVTIRQILLPRSVAFEAFEKEMFREREGDTLG